MRIGVCVNVTFFYIKTYNMRTGEFVNDNINYNLYVTYLNK